MTIRRVESGSPVNMHESQSHLRIALDMPGFTRPEVEVTATGGEIKITAVRKCKGVEWCVHKSVDETLAIHRSDLDVTGTAVELLNGILTLSVPKVASKEAVKTLEISTGAHHVDDYSPQIRFVKQD